jgi:hypothetical protein
MRGLLLGSVISIVTLIPGSSNAGPRALQVDASNIDKPPSATSNYETYRGYVFDLSENSERRDVTAIADMLRHQLDVVEGVGLSPKGAAILSFDSNCGERDGVSGGRGRRRLLWSGGA